jgi:hypothetical protein
VHFLSRLRNCFRKPERRRFDRARLFSLRFRIEWSSPSNSSCVCSRRNRRHFATSTHCSIYNGNFDFLEAFFSHSMRRTPYNCEHFTELLILMRTAAANEPYTRLSAYRDRGCEDAQRIRSRTAHVTRKIKSANNTSKACDLILLITSSLCLLPF